jgi:hypothetical protein
MKKVTLVMIVLSIFILSPSVFAGSNHQGAELSFGGFNKQALGAFDPNYDFTWGNISLFNKHDFNKNWNLNLYGSLGYLRWDSNNDKPNQDTLSIAFEMVLYRKIYKNLSFGLGGGFATLANDSEMPNLGNSGLYGLTTLRLNFKVDKEYGLEFSADHISDAIQSDDAGNNVLALKIYYMFN